MKRIIFVFVLIILTAPLLGCINSLSFSENISLQAKATYNYQNIPSEYTDLISDYEKIVDFRLSPSFEEDYNNDRFVELSGKWADNIWENSESGNQEENVSYKWHCMIVDMIDYIDSPTKSSYGYILSDIDKNGIPELFWVSSDYRILALFTIVNNEVCLIDVFFPNYNCIVLTSGELLTKISITAQEYRYTISDIDNKNGLLNPLVVFGKENNLYFKAVDGKRHILSEEEYKKMYNRYPFIVSNKWRGEKIYFLGQGDGFVVPSQENEINPS